MKSEQKLNIGTTIIHQGKTFNRYHIILGHLKV